VWVSPKSSRASETSRPCTASGPCISAATPSRRVTASMASRGPEEDRSESVTFEAGGTFPTI
jgi:hypothetical protein